MAQTIKIKRSTGSSAPSSLANGELAYLNHASNKKLYIGRPGGGTGDIDVIGGKDFTDKVDGIEASADVTDTANVTSAGALMLTGGTLTGDVVFGDNDKIQLGGTTSNLELYNDGSNSIISENSAGSLILRGTNLSLQSDDNDQYIQCIEDGAVTLYHQNAGNSAPKLATTSSGISVTGGITLTGTVDGRDIATDGTKLDTIEGSADVTDATNVAAAGALMTSGGTMTGELDISNDIKISFGGGDLEIWHDNATTANRASYIKENGTGNLRIMGSNLSLMDSNGEFFLTGTENGVVQLYCNNLEKLRTVATGVAVYGDLEIVNTTVEDGLATGHIYAPAVLVIDPASHSAITGKVVIDGDLEVKGVTTTINSTTVTIADNIIQLNSAQDEATAPPAAMVCGIQVDRGNQTYDSGLKWFETANEWRVSEGGVADYPLLHTNNASTQTYTLDGGSF